MKTQPYRKVFVRGLRIDAEIGVYAHEHGQTQPLIISFEMNVVEPANPISDSIEDVVCYNRFSQSIIDLVAKGHINLIETLAERICQMALEHPMVNGILVRIDKPDAMDKAEAAGIEISRTKE